MGAGLFVILIIVIFGGCFLFGRKTASGQTGRLKVNPKIAKFALLSYVAFAGCFVFPIASELYPLDYSKAYLLIASYGIISLAFAGVYGGGKKRFVYLTVLALTTLGLVCRWLLEYGEVSNTYNFTVSNIVLYLALIPACTVLAYHFWVKYLTKA